MNNLPFEVITDELYPPSEIDEIFSPFSKAKRPVMLTGTYLWVVVPSPSWEVLFRPQINTRPVDVKAAEWSWPTPIDEILSPVSKLKRTVIFVGIDFWVVVLSPSWPYSFFPHVNKRPLEVTATECSNPKRIEVIVSPVWRLNRVVIFVGALFWNVVLSPSWPSLLFPQVKTLLIDVTATEWYAPNAIDVIFSPVVKVKRPVILVGVFLLSVVPSPIWLLPLFPHKKIRPVELIAPEVQ